MPSKRMINQRGIHLVILLSILLLSCTLPTGLFTRNARQEAVPESISPNEARLTAIAGEVLARQPEQTAFNPVAEAVILPVKSQVKTLGNSQARLDLSSGTIIRLGPNTLFTLEVQQSGDEGLFTRIWMDFGKVWIILNGGSLEIETPSGLAAVRGSYMSVEYYPESEDLTVTCMEGCCILQNDMGMMEMVSGEAAEISEQGIAPAGRRMSDNEARQWLVMNPEATMIVAQLTSTVAALPSFTPEPSKTSPATATFTPAATLTNTIQPSPTQTGTARATALPAPAVTLLRSTACRVGPGSKYPLIGNIAAGWTVPVVGRGTEGSWIVRYPYQTSIACWIAANSANPNQAAWFVPVYAPPPLPTNEVEPSSTPDTTKTSAPVIPTKTPTETNTPAPNTPPAISNPSGPTGTLTVCNNPYSVNAADPDGIASVKVQYSINDANFSSPRYAGPLPLTTGSTYSGTLTLSGTTASDKVYWRFIAKDTRGMFSYSYTFMYDDTVGCP
ncbi:MAG: FecR domain-containing protein [Anaerolineaceae bacterium]|nr:FecR domain-containing protein [Anaerolineaceae bacterium]